MSSSALQILEILRHIGTAPGPLSVTEIAQGLSLSTTTAHRGLMTLLNAGYIERYQSSARYIVGGASRRLLQAFLARYAIRDFAMPYLSQLAAKSGETTALVVPIGWYGVRIAAARGANPVVYSRPLGEVRWLDGGAGQKALLAGMDEGEASQFLAHVRFAKSLARRGTLHDELRLIRKQGFAVHSASRGTRAEIGAAVKDAQGRPAAALVVEGHVAEANVAKSAVVPLLLEAAEQMESAASITPEVLSSHYAHIPRDAVRLRAVEE